MLNKNIRPETEKNGAKETIESQKNDFGKHPPAIEPHRMTPPWMRGGHWMISNKK